MSQMKRLMIWLVACVYQWQFADNEIVERFQQRQDVKSQEDLEWLEKQIQVVRNNPLYKDMLSWRTFDY